MAHDEQLATRERQFFKARAVAFEEKRIEEKPKSIALSGQREARDQGGQVLSDQVNKHSSEAQPQTKPRNRESTPMHAN